MSPRFGLALLLLCFVLLGLSDAQRQQQMQQQQKITPRQGQHTQVRNVANGNSAWRGGLGRASGRSTPEATPAPGTTCQVDSTTTSPGADAGPGPEIPSGSDGNMNTLAGNNHDRFKKRNLKVVVNTRNAVKNVV